MKLTQNQKKYIIQKFETHGFKIKFTPTHVIISKGEKTYKTRNEAYSHISK